MRLALAAVATAAFAACGLAVVAHAGVDACVEEAACLSVQVPEEVATTPALPRDCAKFRGTWICW